jgi:putative nucleotidyltransferase with HDIG domain
MKRVLFTDDEPRILDGLRRMLRGQRREWEMVFALEGHAAVAELEGAEFDVVVTDMRMPGLDGVGVLTEVERLHPAAIRVVLSGHTDQADAARAVRVAHQFIAKPSSSDVVRGVIERACSARLDIPLGVRQAVGRLGAVPVSREAYGALESALQSGDASPDAVAALVERDPGMAAKVLQTVNSSFFGISREVTDIASAVRLLGAGVIREMVLVGGVFRPCEADGGLLSMEWLRGHSFEVATLAAGSAGGERSSVLYAAALLHDIGKLILAEVMPDQYAEVMEAARAGGGELHEVERRLLGVDHARVGAYLLNLWNLPPAIVDVVGHHHDPGAAPATVADAVAVIRASHTEERR